MRKFKLILFGLINAASIIFIIAVVVTVLLATYLYGYFEGYSNAALESESAISNLLANLQLEVSSQQAAEDPEEKIIYVKQNINTTQSPNWSGPELWEAVNKRREQLGVSGLANQSELCTIASIRLNEQLELGKLDGHEGFSTLPERREDLKWIFEKYNISEFLVSGATSAEEAVSLWENTLGHKKLLTGGEYVWGCTYAQSGFGVAIAAF